MRNEKGSALSMACALMLSCIALAIGLFAKYVLWPAILKMEKAFKAFAKWVLKQVKASYHARKEKGLKKRQLEFNTDSMPIPDRSC